MCHVTLYISTALHLQLDQVVASIETDKVTVEVRSPDAGVITKLFAAEGDEVSVSNSLFVLSTGGAAPTG